MSILVVCPGCKKSFQVHDKFAGKSGPCPKCKAPIRIPDKASEVKVHTPEEFGGGGRGTTGKLALKPIARDETKFRPLAVIAIVAAVILVPIATFVLGKMGLSRSDPQALFGTGLALLSPFLVVAAYTFLRDDELEPYRGLELWIRAGICAAVYLILWAVFIYAKTYFPPEELWQWFVLAPPFLALGGATAWQAFDLEPGNGFFHYTFYLLVTTVLGWIGGLGWVWQVVKSP
jgi:hypothetical protein